MYKLVIKAAVNENPNPSNATALPDSDARQLVERRATSHGPPRCANGNDQTFNRPGTRAGAIITDRIEINMAASIA